MKKLSDMLSFAKKKVKNKVTGEKIEKDKLYNYKDFESREATIRFLYSYAKTARSPWEEYWRTMSRYYEPLGMHDTTMQMAEFIQSQELPWYPAQCTDGYIHVETQIDPTIPDFEFSGRDDDLDSVKAKQRENVVRFVLDNNKMETMNTRNERRMNKLGLAAWKVAWDMTVSTPRYEGEIKVGNPRVQQLFWDPSVTEDIDECEYFPFPYRMHKMKAARVFAKDLKRIGKSINDFDVGFGASDTEFMQDGDSYDSTNYDSPDETLQIMEWWFHQPEAGKAIMDGLEYTWKAGDIGCVILINQEEVRYIPKYWRKTGCLMYPFSLYCKVPNDDHIVGKSEIEPIKGLMDAADRQLSYAQLMDATTSCDIVVMTENALADGCEFKHAPGSVVKVRNAEWGHITRLEGLAGQHKPLYETADKFKEMMQNTNGNFDAFQGNEPQRVTTATGIAILNDRARSRQDVKKPDRTAGFERLLRLIDYTALENYDDDRLIFIGAKSKDDKPVNFTYNSDTMKSVTSTGEEYYPVPDVKLYVGDGLKNSKAFTTTSLKELAEIPLTLTNYKFIEAYITEIDIPQKVELIEFIEETIAAMKQPQPPPGGGGEPPNIPMSEILQKGGFTPEELDILDQNPEIAAKAAQENNAKIV